LRGYPRYPRTLRELTAALPRHATRPGTRWLEVEPAVYVHALQGVDAVPRDGKVTCPFHEDRHASLHVYETAERGWYCFGRCRHGGTIYDLAAPLYFSGYRASGDGFLRLRAELRRLFGLEAA
jgi:hypothetical protein